MSSDPAQSSTVTGHLESLNALVEVASSLASVGRLIDLSNLDAMTGRLCAQILDLPPNEGVTFRLGLLSLDGKLQRLAETMRCNVP